MHIEFYPPLGSRTLVPVAQLDALISSDVGEQTQNKKGEYVDIELTARLTPGDYASLVSAGVRVETWTNAAGSWEAVPFEEEEEEEGESFGKDAENGTLHLSVDASLRKTAHLRTPSEPGLHVLRAHLRLRTDREAAFTYRLIYPSGVRWLGSAREDGALAPDKDADAYFAGEGDWAKGSRIQTEMDGEDGVDVGKLNARDWEWKGWMVDEDGKSVFSFTNLAQLAGRRARLIYFLPFAAQGVYNVVVPSAQLLRSTAPACSLTIATDGGVVLQAPGAGTVERRVLPDPSSEDAQQVLREALISASRAPEVALINDTRVLFAPDSKNDTGSVVTLCKLAYGLEAGSAKVPADALDSFAQAAKSSALYAPQTHEALFVHGKSASGSIDLSMGGEFAASFAVCGAHALEVNADDSSSNPSSVLLALVSHPYLSPALVEVPPAPSAQAQAQALPTPPASPTHTPRRSPSVSFVLPPTPPSGTRSPRSSRAVRPPPMVQKRSQPPMPRALPLTLPISLPISIPREPLNALRGILRQGFNSAKIFHLNNSNLSLGALLAAAFVAARAKAMGVARLLATALGIIALRALVSALGWVVKRRPGARMGPPRRVSSQLEVRDVVKRDGQKVAPATVAESEEDKTGSEESSEVPTPVPQSPILKPVPALRWTVPARDALVLAVQSPSESTDLSKPEAPGIDVELDGVRSALKPLRTPSLETEGEKGRVHVYVYQVVPLFVDENVHENSGERVVVLQVRLRA